MGFFNSIKHGFNSLGHTISKGVNGIAHEGKKIGHTVGIGLEKAGVAVVSEVPKAVKGVGKAAPKVGKGIAEVGKYGIKQTKDIVGGPTKLFGQTVSSVSETLNNPLFLLVAGGVVILFLIKR